IAGLLQGYCRVIAGLLQGYCRVIAGLLQGYCRVIASCELRDYRIGARLRGSSSVAENERDMCTINP
ncbi:MAG: hypothetical protein WCS18_07550, partial [Sphaerochaetaceae bacterium]